uniref:Uncharacterized protein n=1 Tax=Nothoprocta perdicaria TaxID=30464 RepID=A0A8C7EGD7_NOTPE
MRTLMRQGLAVCAALTTMCTSLLLMYGGIGGGHPEPRQQQQQVAAATTSRAPGRGQQRPALPGGTGLLEGYISVLEHKVSERRETGTLLLHFFCLMHHNTGLIRFDDSCLKFFSSLYVG